MEDYFKDFDDIGINGNIGNGDEIGNNSSNSITINVDNSLDFISPIDNNNDSSAEVFIFLFFFIFIYFYIIFIIFFVIVFVFVFFLFFLFFYFLLF